MADKPIRVTILRPGRRKFYIARWTDPETGRQRSQSTGHVNRRDAERWAAKLEADLNAGGIAKRIKWDAFRDRVKLDYLPERRPATRVTYTSALNALEQVVKPKLVSGVDTAAIDKFKATLRARGASEPTIASYMRALRAVMRWGHARGIVRSVPRFDMPPGASAIAGGKPLNDLQCLKLLAACRRVVGPERAPEWKRLVGGLLASGLRVGEAWALSWDDFSGPHVLLNRAKPMLVIPAASQKSGRDTITPIVPEFLAILESTPKGERTGPVFRAAGSDGKRPKLDAVKRTIAKIGKASGTGATAHDCRRTFCYRWAKRVMPQTLRALARHSDVKTTLTYYADSDAEMTFDAVWDAVGVKTGDT